MIHKFDSKVLRPNKYLPNSSCSLQKPKNKVLKGKRKPNENKKPPEAVPTPPRVISLVQQKTQPPKRRSRPLHQEPELTREFQEITRIYNQSKELENEQDCLYCFENIEEAFGFKGHQAPKSTFSRFSDKSVSQLPSIEEREEEYRQDEHTAKKKVKQGRIVAVTRRKKNTQSVNGDYCELQGKSRERAGNPKTIDMTTLIKSRSKTKSSMSHRAPGRK